LAAYVALVGALALLGHGQVRPSFLGIVVLIVAAAVVPLLAQQKRRLSAMTASAALRADAAESALCGYLSIIPLAGLVAHVFWGITWADPVAARCAMPLVAWEGRQTLQGKPCHTLEQANREQEGYWGMSVEDGPIAKRRPLPWISLGTGSFMPSFHSFDQFIMFGCHGRVKGNQRSDAMAKRVLVADDSNLIRKQIRTIIESDAQLEVCAEALNGLEGLQKVQESCPDLAIIDFQMPMMDGLKATRKIKRLMPLLPILLFTLSSSPQLEWESKRAGADAVLLKMEGSTGLPGVIHSLLQNR
jgi:CheY-like chemotaxis protein